MNRLIAIVILALLAISVSAQDESDSAVIARPVASMFMADVGHASVLDSYLTPITYGGIHTALTYAATQATGFSPDRWVRQLEVGVEFAGVNNPVGNNDMQMLMAHAQWGIMHRWRGVFTPGLQLMLGGMTRLHGGVIYNSGNSNNVVSAKAHFSVGAMGMAVYNTHIGRLPITLAYQASLPVVGVFFSPDYDESFYEMYLGNHHGLAHMGWWGNRFDMTNLVTADLHLGNTIVRVGYRNRIERSWVNHLNTHITTHALVLGVGGEFLSISRRGVKPQAKIISSMY